MIIISHSRRKRTSLASDHPLAARSIDFCPAATGDAQDGSSGMLAPSKGRESSGWPWMAVLLPVERPGQGGGKVLSMAPRAIESGLVWPAG